MTSYQFRNPSEVMMLERLGSLHQFRLSFMRTLIRRIMRDQWLIECPRFDLDEKGYGTAVYTIAAGHDTFSFVLFSQYLSDEDRNDRVIASQWDLTMALVVGEVNEQRLATLKGNVPRQEAGRVDADTLVLSRANRSSRNFEYVVNELASGHQPDVDILKNVGYLYRTTAVYGSGKFGMADWERVRKQYPDFARPFSAEMFTCYMLRHFSVEQAEHIARMRSPDTAVPMGTEIRRYIGIGNSTGLGMAPYLIRHPQLISRWVAMRETAIARVLQDGHVSAEKLAELKTLVIRARRHFEETSVPDEEQAQRNETLIAQLTELQEWLEANAGITDWTDITVHAKQHWHLETQELIHSLLMELYPELVDEYEEQMCSDEQPVIQPEMQLSELRQLIESRYDWALAIDFEHPDSQHLFWYRSEEKMEPRIGERLAEPGADREIPIIPVGRSVRRCYDRICDHLKDKGDCDLAHFLLAEPDLKGIVTRIQTMAQDCYGEIRANLCHKETLPIHLLRCKLSFFGVSKFDPKSKFWVRNTMFQGAPLLTEIGEPFLDDWYFPVAPGQLQ